MFFIWSSFRVMGICLALVLIGMMVLPGHIVSIIVGFLAVVGGIVWIFSTLVSGILSIVVGVGLIVFGVMWRVRLDREENRAGEETVERMRRNNTVYIPPDDPP